MALSIKHPDADRLARELARRQGRTLTDAVVHALREELDRERRRTRSTSVAQEILAIARQYQALPTLDNRRAEEILGYDEDGLPR
ncbi:MAG: type II toxin-antitoxin system VapB family antitoxin [Planctomycetes bacterium]|nr:type II toxin-antitoxin system VapB family antitoxin [Planctomycetota bacterium]